MGGTRSDSAAGSMADMPGMSRMQQRGDSTHHH
jgi:hypothetical protein